MRKITNDIKNINSQENLTEKNEQSIRLLNMKYDFSETVKYENDKERIMLIKKIERLVRRSFEYKEFIEYLKNFIDMNSCSFLKNIKRQKGVMIEIHHHPLTLYDITETLLTYFERQQTKFDIYDVVDLILIVHFKGIVGLIPLSSTVHTMVHNGSIIIPKDKQFANYEEFINLYGNYMSSELHKKLNEYNMNASAISDDVSLKLKERCTFIELDGINFPKIDNGKLVLQ